MARTRRIDPGDAWHHVMNRGARHQPIFSDGRDRRRFLGLLDDLHRAERIETHAYCLMGNHYHLVLYCPDGNLSAGMHHLGSRYAQWFNRRHDFDGPLFRGRFLSKPIESDEYLLQASRYVHRNPLDRDPAIDLVSYPWSSYRFYLRRREAPGWLHRSMVLGLVGGDPADYRSFVESDRAIGSLSDLAATVVATTRRVAPSLLEGRGGDTVVRNLTLVVAIDGHHATTEALARHFGMASTSSVWSAVHRTQARAMAEPAVRAVLDCCRIEPSWSVPSEHMGA